MQPIPFEITDWKAVDTSIHPGETGTAIWKTITYGDLRIRMVEYSAGYKADHWCDLGHILFCLKGELISELSDGSTQRLRAGMSYQVSDNMSRHRSYTETGATLFIVDGEFLAHKRTMQKGVFGLQ